MRCLRRILDIKWLDKVTNNEVFARTGLSSLYTLLQQRRLRWLGHVSRMPDGRIPKDLLYGELASGSRVQGRPHLRFKDACKRDMKALEPDPTTGCWWPQTETSGGRSCIQQEAHRKPSTSVLAVRSARLHALFKPSTFKCTHCDRDCLSRVGFYSHSRSCSPVQTDSKKFNYTSLAHFHGLSRSRDCQPITAEDTGITPLSTTSPLPLEGPSSQITY